MEQQETCRVQPRRTAGLQARIMIMSGPGGPRSGKSMANFLLLNSEPRRFRMLSRRAALLSTAALPFVRGAQAQQQQTLRIAMTVADIPATDGVPDQGTEGIRFMGYTLYDPLIMWDLSSADRPARLIPGLATAWRRDPGDPTKWIFELRRGVKFHDGSEFTADAVIFNLGRALRSGERRRLAPPPRGGHAHGAGRAAAVHWDVPRAPGAGPKQPGPNSGAATTRLPLISHPPPGLWHAPPPARCLPQLELAF